jgi:hypothetical protein
MTVVEGWLFGNSFTLKSEGDVQNDFVKASAALVKDAKLAPRVCEIFQNSIAVNSTAYEAVPVGKTVKVFLGNKSESALLKFSRT